NRGNALAAADAHGFEAEAAVPAYKLARQIGEDTPAGCANRVAKRNARAVDVEDVVAAVILRPAPALKHGKNLRRKGLVEFDKVDIVPAKAAAREQSLDRRDRADAHPARIAAGCGRAVVPGNRLESELVELVLGDDKAGRRGIILLACVASGDDAALERLELAQRLHRGVGAVTLVMRENNRVALLLRHRHGHQLIVEEP